MNSMSFFFYIVFFKITQTFREILFTEMHAFIKNFTKEGIYHLRISTLPVDERFVHTYTILCQ